MKGFLLLSGILMTSPAWGQKVTVRKVKGNQAVVQVSGGTLEVGQTYNLGAGDGGEEFESTVTAPKGGGSRARVLGFSAILASVKSESSGSSANKTEWGASGRYGWNHKTMEYGLIGTFSSSDTGGGASMTYGGGGFFDFNMAQNKPGVDMVFGGGIDGQYLMTSIPNGGGSTTTMAFFPHGFLKWFALGNATALRFDLGYGYNETSFGSAKTKVSGISGRGGLYVYF